MMMTDFNQLKATFEELQKLKAEEERKRPKKFQLAKAFFPSFIHCLSMLLIESGCLK